MRSLPAKTISKISVRDGTKTKFFFDNGQRSRRFMPFKVLSPINLGPNHHVNIAKVQT